MEVPQVEAAKGHKACELDSDIQNVEGALGFESLQRDVEVLAQILQDRPQRRVLVETQGHRPRASG